jgi:uncharacterized membrane protein
MALHPDTFPEFSPRALWLRLPLQALLIAWAWWYTAKTAEKPRRGSHAMTIP